MITSTGWGGLEMNILKIAKLLSKRNYNITLITKEESTIYTKGKDVFSDVVLLNNVKKYFDFKSAIKISNALKQRDIKTILVFDNKDIDVIAWAKKLFFNNLNIIYQQQMQIGINKKDFLHTIRYKTIDVWISPLEYLKEEIKHRTNYPVERVEIIPLCTDINKFTNRKYTKEQALKKLNITLKLPLVGIIGRISEKKGQKFLVESLIKLRKENINFELLIFGSPTVNDTESQEYYKQLLKLVKDNDLENIVHLVEYREDVSLFYNAVDLFILASHSETFGMVTIEAMLSNIPILGTKSGGTSDILEYGKLGALYEYENYDEFKEKIIWFLSNTDEAIKIAKQAQNIAITKYDSKVEVDGFDRIIKSVY